MKPLIKSPTTLDILKCIPLTDALRTDIVTRYATMDQGERYELTRIIWDALWEYHRILADEYFEILLARAGRGEEQLTTDLYDRAVKEVWDHLEIIWSGHKTDTQELDEIRSQLQNKLASAS